MEMQTCMTGGSFVRYGGDKNKIIQSILSCCYCWKLVVEISNVLCLQLTCDSK